MICSKKTFMDLFIPKYLFAQIFKYVYLTSGEKYGESKIYII